MYRQRSNQTAGQRDHLVALLLCAAGLIASCERAGHNEDPIVARVGDDVITIGYLDRAIRGASREERVEYVSPPQVRELVDTLIDRKLMAVKALNRDLEIADALADSPLHAVLRTALASPLVFGGRCIGTLTLYDRAGRRFGDEERRRVSAVGGHVARAVHNFN